MTWWTDIIIFLSGKKTYLMIVIDALDAFGVVQGWWDEHRMRTIVEGLLTGMAATAHITKSGPTG